MFRYSAGNGESLVESRLLFGVERLGGFEALHEPVELHLRATERPVLPGPDDEAFLGNASSLACSFSFHRAEFSRPLTRSQPHERVK